ncbi:hypothetical protein Pmar_PMAR017338 [Perkinsus marinus ATCC 50983]|uniref:Uncharacterized protein n=1 Tax=Perkinsus marinus (strain ATCC 50983 / TXsc) TaxID=423536 RepID=C5LHB5_PERM5|nr:hypothetical protein Pmar_PMAR017338 [Perkinsus marinus ATCC 50983]EER03924.1 hypothetical protein Pmar_PMAR017338 [Perkinsus marinus ATCC 50983]|eukprot:XP_002772108.1 hypothetical protein Pmar_PMAR017338 [Perkinsus marinus ATCC 50983]
MRDTKRGLTGTLDLSENPVLTDEAIIRICGAIEKKRMLFIDSIMLNNCSKIHDRSARALGKVIRNTLAMAKEHLEVLTIEAILATDNVGLEEKYQRQPDEDPRTIDTSAFGKRENSENAEVDDDDDNEEGEEADEKRKMEERRTKWEQSMREKLDHIDSIEVDAFEDDIELPENCSRSGSTSRTTRRLEELLRSLQDAVEECTKITCMDIRCDEFPWIHDATKILAVEHKLQIDRIAAFGNGMTEDSSVNSSDASERWAIRYSQYAFIRVFKSGITWEHGIGDARLDVT